MTEFKYVLHQKSMNITWKETNGLGEVNCYAVYGLSSMLLMHLTFYNIEEMWNAES